MAQDWSHYGGDAGGRRYSSASQIDRTNVGRLERVWIHSTGEHGEGARDRHKTTFEATRSSSPAG